MTDSNQYRRRRPVGESNLQPEGLPLSSPTNSSLKNNTSVYHYYDDDDSEDNKGYRHNEDRIFQGSCSFGQFVLNPCLCMFNTAIVCVQRQRRYRSGRPRSWGRILRIVLLAVGIFRILVLKLPHGAQFSSLDSSASSIRPLTDEAVNEIPISIPLFDYGDTDIGGWRHLRRFFHPKGHLDPFSVNEPDFGGLDLIETRNLLSEAMKTDPEERQKHMQYSSSLHSKKLLPTPRVINPEDEELAAAYWEKFHSFDPHISRHDLSLEDREDEARECFKPNWARGYYPNCHAFHELGLNRDYDEERAKKPHYDGVYDTYYVSHGYWRDTWVVNKPAVNNPKTVVKMSRWKHEYNHEVYMNVQVDAMVMERLTQSPRIVDLYGHCGTAVWVEAIPHELEEVIIHGNGMAKQEDLHDEDGLKPLNPFTVEQKLDIALIMAEGLADLHGFRDGVIVHDDVQLCQWLRTYDGRIKLGDFNRAEVMDYNFDKKEYCEYYNGHGWGNYRAPEEFVPDYLTEQIDVFSFGNNIYGLLTGLWVFYDTDDDETVHKKLIDGTRAFIDPRWRTRSPIEAKLVEVMEACWSQKPADRITIFEAVQKLREIKSKYEKDSED